MMTTASGKIRGINKVAAIVFAALLSSCAQAAVDKITSTALDPLLHPSDPIPDNAYLDVGVPTFDPGIEITDETDTVLPEVRDAEAIYLSNQLVKTLEQSAAWGAVRVIPNNDVVVDVYVMGRIVQSDGETLSLDIQVYDASGREWFANNYELMVGKYTYSRKLRSLHDPFQNIYNRIANDMLAYREQLGHEEARRLRTLSELKFLKDFAPQAYSGYVTEGKKGMLDISRLPAENDPTVDRIRRIRERDYLYIDTMQDYYDVFSRRMHTPYQSWRKESYDTVVKVRKLRKEARRKKIAGVVAVVAGIAGRVEADSTFARDSGTVTAAAGGYLLKSGLQKSAEAEAQTEVLAEMGASLQSEIEPQIIELEDRTITLSGTVDAQYQQWKELLRQIYEAEYGQVK